MCAVRRVLGRPLRDVVLGEESGCAGSDGVTQPALFAVEVALFRLVESLGCAADFVAGHSVGELVAAYVAGVLSLEDACVLVAARGRLMQALPAGGAMVAVQAAEDEVAGALRGLWVGGVDRRGERSGVGGGVGCRRRPSTSWRRRWRGRGVRSRRLVVSHAFHSPLMEPMLEEFRAVARGVDLSCAADRGGVECVGPGRCRRRRWVDPEYWVRHVREAVRFADGWRACAAGCDVVPGVRPGRRLTAMARDASARTTAALTCRFCAAVDRRSRRRVAAALAATARARRGRGLVRLLRRDRRARVDLPTYAFQRRDRFWLERSYAQDGSAVAVDGLHHRVVWRTVAAPARGRAAVRALAVPEARVLGRRRRLGRRPDGRTARRRCGTGPRRAPSQRRPGRVGAPYRRGRRRRPGRRRRLHPRPGARGERRRARRRSRDHGARPGPRRRRRLGAALDPDPGSRHRHGRRSGPGTRPGRRLGPGARRRPGTPRPLGRSRGPSRDPGPAFGRPAGHPARRRRDGHGATRGPGRGPIRRTHGAAAWFRPLPHRNRLGSRPARSW